MANHHFGKFADIWKHLVVNEVLAGIQPVRYAETHVGSAAYPMVTDVEREYGVRGFLRGLESVPALRTTPYARTLARFMEAVPPMYPGSGLQAMELLGDSAAYLLCDVDPASAKSLSDWASRLGVGGCRVAQEDGMTSVRDWLRSGSGAAAVHIDPFDPFAHENGGPSAVELASDIARGDHHALIYWYGYSRPDQRAWAFSEIGAGEGSLLWCGDFMVTTFDGSSRSDGDLGKATTPGTGSGVVLANIPPGLLRSCEEIGRALAHHYESVTLPTGEAGRLDFSIHVTQ